MSTGLSSNPSSHNSSPSPTLSVNDSALDSTAATAAGTTTGDPSIAGTATTLGTASAIPVGAGGGTGVTTGRRPSISSLSSASGYASGASMLGARVQASRHPGSLTPLSQTAPLHAHAAAQNNPTRDFNPSWLPQQTNTLLNVTPWIEQQAQVAPMQSLSAYGEQQQSKLNARQTPTQQVPTTNLSLLTQTRAVPMNPSSTAGSINGSLANAAERQAPQPVGYSQYGRFPRSPAANNDVSMRRSNTNTTSNNANANSNTNNTNTNNNSNGSEEIIPTAVVIKNIPFAIKKEQLLDFMAKLNLPLPYAFNYHFDNGVFRGLAFANFNTTDETSLVVNLLNSREIGGRKLRVEYKKMLPPAERERIEREKRERRGQLEEQHRSASATSLASLYSIASAPPSTSNPPYTSGVNNGPTVSSTNAQAPPSRITPERLYVTMPPANQMAQPPAGIDMNNPDALEIYTKLTLFRDELRLGGSSTATELAFQSAALTGNQRRVISLLSQFLGLPESQENGFIVIRRPPPQIPPALMRSHSHSLLNSASALSMNTGRYRQQSPRAVSQQAMLLQQSSMANGPFGMNNAFSSTVGGQGTLHHSSSTASLNLPRQGGFTAPSTPNPSRMAFGNTGGLSGGYNTGYTGLAANTFGAGNGMFNASTSNLPQQGFNNPQLTGESTISTNAKGLDDLFVGMENLSFER